MLGIQKIQNSQHQKADLFSLDLGTRKLEVKKSAVNSAAIQ